jgi:hypothetical protein
MQVRLIVPNCNCSTSPIVAYGARIANIAGGFTATQATGGWTDASGALVVEPVTVFDADDNYANAPLHAEAFADLARTIKADLSQDCVYLRIDGVVEYV